MDADGATVVPAEGAILDRILDEEYANGHAGLTRAPFGRLDTAQTKTAWGRSHQRRFALMEAQGRPHLPVSLTVCVFEHRCLAEK